MGTRTAIFKEQADGTYQGIYCHWDGYIEGVGAVYMNITKTLKKFKKLSIRKKACPV